MRTNITLSFPERQSDFVCSPVLVLKAVLRKTNTREGRTVKREKQGHVSYRHRYHFPGQLPECLQCRKCEVCKEFLTLMEFWQEKQLHCSQIKGKLTPFPSPPPHNSLAHFLRHLTPLLSTFNKTKSPNMTTSKPCYFSSQANQRGSRSFPDRKLLQKPNVFPA